MNKEAKLAKIKQQQAAITDALKQPANVGDFVIATKGHRVFPATIGKITKTGKSVYVRECKVDAPLELVSFFYVINENTKKAAMLRKLGAE